MIRQAADDVSLVAGGGRNLEALKQEVQRRADHGLPPLSGIAPEDARAALSTIHGLEREEWARAWSGVAENHWDEARKLEPADCGGARKR